jgi:hypothetical protein
MTKNLADRRDKVLSKRDKRKSMSDTTFAMNAIQEAFPKKRFGSVYAAQYEAFNYLRKNVRKEMTMRRIRSLWEGKARRVDGEEKDALRWAKIEEAKREQAELRERLSKIDAALAAINQTEDRQALSKFI